jgi:hypothetical protein
MLTRLTGPPAIDLTITLIAILTTELRQAKDSLNANQSQPCDWLRRKIGKLEGGIKTAKEMNDKVVRASLEKRDWFTAVTSEVA